MHPHLFLLLSLLCTLVHGFERAHSGRWDHGFGRVSVEVEAVQACPIADAALCPTQHTVQPLINIDVGALGAERAVCLGNVADPATGEPLYDRGVVTLFYDPARASRRYDGASDLFIVQGLHMRLPVRQAPRRETQTARCQAVLPLGDDSPLAAFWANFTLDAHRLTLGGLPRSVGVAQQPQTPPLQCFPTQTGVCAFAADIANATYTVELSSGSRYTRAPPSLVAALESQLLHEPHATFALEVPGAAGPGFDLAGCRAAAAQAAVDADAVCSADALRIEIPLRDVVVGDAPNGGTTRLLVSSGVEDGRVQLTSLALKNTRVFYDRPRRVAFLSKLRRVNEVEWPWLVLLLVLLWPFLRHMTLTSPHVWRENNSGRGGASLSEILTIAGELTCLALSLLPLSSGDTRHALDSVPAAARNALFVAHAINVALGVAVAVVLQRAAWRRVSNSVSATEGSVQKFLRTERAAAAYSNFLGTGLLLGALLVMVQRTPGDTGTVWTLLPTTGLALHLLGTLMRVVTIESAAAREFGRKSLNAYARSRLRTWGDRAWALYVAFCVTQVAALTALASALVWGDYVVRTFDVARLNEVFIIMAFTLLLTVVAVNSHFSFRTSFYLAHPKMEALLQKADAAKDATEIKKNA